MECVRSAQESIYTEYGHGKPLPPQGLVDRRKMFKLDLLDLTKAGAEKEINGENGGWSTKESRDALKKRLLHAMMTNDDFTIVLGGGSHAAGHGNHFQQSYLMQLHSFISPIFTQLGIKLKIYNLASRGSSTLHSSLGSGSIYGSKIDMLLWDDTQSKMSPQVLDLLVRQSILAGDRPPVIWARSGGAFPVLRLLNLKGDIDCGGFGSGLIGVPVSKNEAQAKTLPYATRFLKCDKKLDKKMCQKPDVKFQTRCWVEREDVHPSVEQRKKVEADAQSLGWREHQLISRVLAFTILDVFSAALGTWSEITIVQGQPLPDEYWHVTDHYQGMREKIDQLGFLDEKGFCEGFGDSLPKRICTVGLKARTEFTPRADPEGTSIVGIIKPAKDGYLPSNHFKMYYDGPDVLNPALSIPENEFNGLRVVEAITNPASHNRILADEVIPGLGWSLDALPGNCNGTAEAICGRLSTSDCLLDGHMDYQGGLVGDSFSGWLLLELKNVINNIIVLKIDTNQNGQGNPRTETWTAENNQRRLKKKNKNLVCDAFAFDYAVDGKITTFNGNQFFEKVKEILPGEQFLTIMDDNEGSARNIEVGIRLRGCGRDTTLKLTHVYWA